MDYSLLGNSVQIREINETIKHVAPTDISVLITGESGTGKEIVANLIHLNSRRKDKPFITVNCGAIPEGIIESELFGHQKGAFTGAIENREGYFEMADKGTIFLDEIGEMPLSTQVKILRVLETGEFMKVGGNKTITTDVRVIAATNRNLAKEVINKNFREDLYFRLRSINIHIPPLRERKSDVELLFNYFIENFSKKNKIEFKGIDEESMEYLKNYAWTGNARELRNFCESIIVLVPDRKITIDDVKRNLRNEITESRQLPALQTVSINRDRTDKDIIMRALFELKSDIMDIKSILNEKEFSNFTDNNYDDFVIKKDEMLNMSYDEIEKKVFQYLLKLHNYDVQKLSEVLGQSVRNIYRIMKKFDIRKN